MVSVITRNIAKSTELPLLVLFSGYLVRKFISATRQHDIVRSDTVPITLTKVNKKIN